MKGFHKICGINWLKGEGEWTTLWVNNKGIRISAYKSQLPEHWEKVKRILLTK